jgi:hypothetical protein
MRTPRPANDNAKARTQVRALHGEVLPPPSPARLQEAFARHAAPCSFRDQVMLLTRGRSPAPTTMGGRYAPAPLSALTRPRKSA